MTPDQITQLRQLLKKAKKDVGNLTPAEICYPLYGEVSVEKIIDKALAILPCETCNGTSKVHWNYGDPEVQAIVKADCPCPDCK